MRGRWPGARRSILSRWPEKLSLAEAAHASPSAAGQLRRPLLPLLADPAQPWRSRMPWDKLDLYWVDERTVPPDNDESNYRMTREALLDHVPLRAEQIHRMEGELDPDVAAARYESELRNGFRLEGAEGPRFDLIALGMGPDGHTASLFPHTEAIHNVTSLVTANPVPANPVTKKDTVADHADLAGNQPCQIGFFSDCRSRQSRDFEGSADRPAATRSGYPASSSGPQAVYLR